MKKHYFLGTAARFTKKDRVFMRRGHGKHQDLTNLYNFLHDEYNGGQVIVTINGRSAITAGLKYYLQDYLGIKEGEVIINGFTCYAVVQGVKAAGFTPIFADINKKTLNFTLETLTKALTPKTRALIVQNTLGNMVNIQEIKNFCKKHGLVLIEDLAHCTGRLYTNGKEAGKVGDLTVFSFGKEKTIDVVSGGAVVFRDSKFPPVLTPQKQLSSWEKFQIRMYPTIGNIYRILSYIKLNSLFMGLMLKLKWVVKSADAKIDYKNKTLSNFQAKMALVQLKNRQKNNHAPIREFYLVKERDTVLQKLKKAGYFFDGFWYERPVSPERYYKKVHFPEEKCPIAVEVSQKIINFPTHYKKNELELARHIIKDYLEIK